MCAWRVAEKKKQRDGMGEEDGRRTVRVQWSCDKDKSDGKSVAGLLYKQRVLTGTGVYDQTVYMPAHQGSDIGLFFFDTIVTADK